MAKCMVWKEQGGKEDKKEGKDTGMCQSRRELASTREHGTKDIMCQNAWASGTGAAGSVSLRQVTRKFLICGIKSLFTIILKLQGRKTATF